MLVDPRCGLAMSLSYRGGCHCGALPTHPDFEAEQAYLDRAFERLEAMREAARGMLGSVLAEGKGGTHQAREERDVIVRSSLGRLEQLDIGEQALCFGRIDSDGMTPPGAETFYIGRLAVSDENFEPLVVDWRAPVAEPFYRATARHPMGLALRRHFLTEGSTLVSVEDEAFGNGALGESRLGGSLVSALDRARTGHMRDIVATIQSEQDQIIRAPLAGVLVVQGGPGTGKTAVALHRAAYLLYTHRFPLERQGVLVVGPNQLFLRYIEQVLPSLGESGAVLTTLGGLVPDIRVRRTEEPSVASLKGEARMSRLLWRALRDRQRPLRAQVGVGFGSHVLRLSVDDSAAVVAAARRRPGSHNARRRFVEARVARILHQSYLDSERRLFGRVPDSRRSPGDSDDSGLASEDELRRYLRRDPVMAAALERMWPRLLPQELLHDLFGAPALLALAGRSIFSDQELATLARSRSTALEEIPWTDADVALIDEAKGLLGPVHPGSDGSDGPRTYGHLVVDEAQDLTPMQLRMLARRSISGSMTVVGDLAQTTGAAVPDGWAAVTQHLTPRRAPTVVQLSVNYRTPAEVMRVAAAVLAEADRGTLVPTAARATGTRPAAVAVERSSRGSVLAALANAERATVGGGNVAVVCADSDAAQLAGELKAAGLDFGSPDADGLERAVTLVPVGMVKGLEFDSVIVVEPTSFLDGTPRGGRYLYVALTRATRRLMVVHSQPLPASLAGLERLERRDVPDSIGDPVS
jgi:DNA helicase IV